MAGLTLALADAVLKEDYKGPLRKQINDSVVLAAQVAKNTEDIVGRRAIVPLHVSRNTGVGARAEGGTMPTAGNQGTVDQLVSVRSNYGRIRLTRQSISRMEKDRGAFIRATKLEMDGLRDDTSVDYNRQLWGTSNGVIAQCGTTTASTTVQLATTTSEAVMVMFAEGMMVDIGTVANPVLRATARTVSAIDFTNKTFVVSGAAITTASTDFVFRSGAGGASADQVELTGIGSIVDDTGALFGVDPTTYFSWASIVEGNSGTPRPVSENLVSKAIMRTRQRSGRGKQTLYAEGGVVRSAVNSLSAKHRIVNTLTLKGGYEAVQFVVGGTAHALVEERHAPVGKLFGLSHEDLVEFVDEDWQWEDLDGSALHLAMDGTHCFEAYWFKFSEFATTKRNAHFVIEDVEQS